MKNKQKGFIVPAVIMAVVLVIGGGIYYFSQKPKSSQTEVNLPPTQTATTESKTNVTTETPVVKETETVVQAPVTISSKQITPTAPAKTTPSSAPVAPKKNVYTNVTAGYSIELPSGWVAKDAGAPDSFISTNFSDSSGKISSDNIAFSVSLTPRKVNEDGYEQINHKKLTTQEMVDGFIRDREDNDENWSTVVTNKTTLSGYETYIITVNYGGDYATSKVYLVFTPNNIYNITRMIVTSKLSEIEPIVNPSILSFKVL